MPKVSVIMPSLNVVNYIEQAVESVVNQTLRDIEIICVDAGSEDGTLEILQRYAANDERIKLIMSDKKSYGYQMNLGIEKAIGEYIGIVETDDYIKPDMYEVLYKIASENKLDFVKSDFEKFWWNEENSMYVKVGREEDYNVLLTEDSRDAFFDFSSLNWTGIYKREYLLTNNITHSETPGASYQDIGFWLLNMSLAKRAMWIPKAFYMYRQDNPASSMKNRGKMLCSMGEYNRVLEILKTRNEEKAYKECLMLKHMDYHVTFNRIDDFLKREYLGVISEEYKKDCGEVQKYMLTEEEAINIQWVENALANADEVCDVAEKSGLDIRKKLDDCRHIYLYGAGLVAQRCFERLYSAGYWDQVDCIVVSNETDTHLFFNKKVIILDSLANNCNINDKDLFILGVGLKYKDEVKALLEQQEITNIISAKDLEALVYVI